MLKYMKELYDDLVSRLNSFHRNGLENDPNVDHPLTFILEAIHTLRLKLRSYVFTDEEEEISFFKTSLPAVLSLYIYYTEKFELEVHPVSGTAAYPAEYHEKVFRKTEDFFNENRDFFKYYRSGKTNLDNYYFLRDSPMNRETIDLLACMVDPSFCTVYSMKLAFHLAYTRLEQEIRGQAPVNDQEFHLNIPKEDKLDWTDGKTGLIELIYSLREQGAFNNGKADIKKIVRYFERVFSVDLGNTSSSFQRILSRQAGITNYLDQLRDKLAVRIDEIDQRSMR